MNKHIRFFRLALFVFLILLHTVSFAQVKKRKVFEYKKSAQSRVSAPTDRLSNTLIVKLKEEHADFLEQNDKTLSTLFYPLDIVGVHALFPITSAEENNTLKSNTVKLELVYVIEYNPSTMDMDGTIVFLMGFGYFEYCEPYYTPSPSFIPNDPNTQPGGELLFNLQNVNAFEAWDIEQGDPNVIIGVVDTGFEITHDDLKNKFVPGWDVAGNDANVVHPTNDHGTQVAGTCAAEVNNNIGVAGSGFNCRFMPIKAAADGGDAIVAGYQGLKYAADNGCKIINLSWGGLGGYSATLQLAIDYAAIDNDITIVAAAGNYDVEGDFYPAAYNHVLSVCALDTIYSPSAGKRIDIRTRFRDIVAGLAGTYAYSVDMGACGTALNTTNIGNGYISNSGSSLSSPFVAGAAALLRSKYPSMTGLQIAELLRVTSDSIDHYEENLPFKEKLGKGRLNMYRALTDNISPSVRMRSFTASGKHGSYLLVGDTITVTLDLWNYLRKTNNLSIYFSSTSSSVSVLTPSINPGVIDSMQGMLTTALPLKFKINPSAAQSEKVHFRLGYTDPVTGYSDYQHFYIVINPSMLDIGTSKILSTITSNGLIGFDAQQNGQGVQYGGYSLLYEGGLLIGAPGNKVSDCVRGTSGTPDNEFKRAQSPRYIDPAYKDIEIQNLFNDSLAASIIGVSVEQRSYAFDQTGLDQSFIVEYQIKNNTPTTLDTLYAGLFFDWDIGPGTEYNRNKANFDYGRKMGYAYSTIANRPYAGVQLLTKENVTYYAMDNGTVTSDASNINPNSGAWTSALKYKCMKSGIGRAAAGNGVNGFDISNLTGAEILNIAPGEVRTVAFAILAADNLSSLQSQADNIKAKFVSMKTSKTPTGNIYYLCENEIKDITLAPGNGNNFKFYDKITDVNHLATGLTYAVLNAAAADTLYAAGADSLYESTSRAPLYINNTATARADFGTQTTTLTLPSDATLYMFSSSQNYTSLTWDYGDGNGTTNTTNPSHTYTVADVYTVKLTATDDKGCSSTQEKNITATLSTGIKVYPNPATKSIGFGNDITDLGTLQFINSIGQVLYEKENILLNEQNSIDVISWPEGIYTVVFNTAKKQYIEHLLIRR
ncbi:MAG: in-like serine protease [Cytophagaceae bacterium]|jgi:subtilisin family serine protease/PKD repeat protein|nr:in-like serine protease [Cytophagaceae bacterium]